ncbi:MAG: hypothetical protein LUE19_03905 [Clostridiales bacterium]|nr:hypothetical protein [Clostridiales bacterium]
MGFFQNTCKPEGFGGKIMVTTMNGGYMIVIEGSGVTAFYLCFLGENT